MIDEGARVTAIEAYCLGKLISEAGELGQVAGNALCFGIDTPDHGKAARVRIEEELGDLHAAMTFAACHGIIRSHAVAHHSIRKLQKLLDPRQKDNLGRPLAPQPENTSASPIPPLFDPRVPKKEAAEEPLMVSGQVADAIRTLTEHSQVTVDIMLRRLLKLGPAVCFAQDGSVGYRDPGTGLTLPEGFEIFRVWQGKTYRAKAKGGQWVTPEGQRFDNLNRLNASLGKPNPENAWIVWYFLDGQGQRQLLNSIRPLPKPRNRRPRTRQANS
ncbi:MULTISPECIES: hypothetical protein [Microvirga]|uniref:hypothetical protein n=1 Tax=Microvirga TaxID=186650 RepID=UPI0021CA85A6|nr:MULTISPECIES: hypothetical protein [unclassified Microvirga]